MRIDNKTLKGRLIRRCKARHVSGGRLTCCVCWFFTVLCWLWSDSSPAAASSVQADSTRPAVVHASQPRQTAQTRNSTLPADSNLRHQLWRALISVPSSREEAGAKKELGQLIEQIGSVEFKPQSKSSGAVENEPDSKTEPNSTADDVNTPEGAAEKQTDSSAANKTIREQTLFVVEQSRKQPEQLENPCELGEILFLSGNLKEAATFYEEALNRSSVDDAASADHKAWILYQLGNCLRHDDMPKARQTYRQLIERYPDSFWSSLAKAQEQLIGWYLSEKPETLAEGDILHGQQPTVTAGGSTD